MRARIFNKLRKQRRGYTTSNYINGIAHDIMVIGYRTKMKRYKYMRFLIRIIVTQALGRKS